MTAGLVAATAVLAVGGASGVAYAVTHQVGAPPAAPSVGTTGALPSGAPAASGPLSPSTVASPTSTAVPSATPSSAPTPSGPAALAASKPVRVRIPKIGVDLAPQPLALESDGEMAVPVGIGKIGWFTGAPTPGSVGPAVIAAHVTWNGEPDTFYRLGALRPGDTVEVSRADGRTAVFTVTGSRTYPKTAFPSGDVYGNLDYAGLRLITCGGDYDRAHHSYPDNTVVYARLTAVR